MSSRQKNPTGSSGNAAAQRRCRGDHAEILARQVRHCRRRRDRLHARLGQVDAGAGIDRGAQRHGRRGAQGLRDRRHAVVSVQRLGVLALRRRRPRHPAQFLHGRVRRGIVDRGVDRHRDRRHRGRHVQDGGDLPLHERFLAGADRRHRRALRSARLGRHDAQPRLWLAERGADVRADLHAPHARFRHRPPSRSPMSASPTLITPRTIPRPITRSASRRRRSWAAA